MDFLSVVIITYNEERNIARCIESVRLVADEIIVLDSFSNDSTKAICEKAGVEFHQHVFDGHIEQKNRAKDFCKYPLILSLDADEALSEELQQSILDVKKEAHFEGYEMSRLTNYCGQWIYHCGWYPDRKLRLWKKDKGEWKGMNPHDKFELFDAGKKIGFLKGNLLHYSYYSIDEHYRQANKFSEIAADVLFKNNVKTSYLHIIVKVIAKFVRNYFLKLGFLDKKNGFIICKITAYETYLKYSKLFRLQKGEKL